MNPAAQTILVVDDDREIRSVLKSALSSRGYQVALAVDGQDAIDQLRGGLRPALILLDLTMPRIDGRAFLAWQRQETPCAATPVVLLTGRELEAQELEALGCRDTLSKLLDLEQLFSTVRRCLLAAP